MDADVDQPPVAPGDDSSRSEMAARQRRRMSTALTTRRNWVQLIKFGMVGASGFVVNLVIYKLALDGLGAHYIAAASIAFVVALTNNFLLNRHWTFNAREGHAGFQAARFVTVSLTAFAFNLVVLKILVAGFDVDKVLAQALAVASATPLNFVGNKMWSFRLARA